MWLHDALDVVQSHHEKNGGTGYREGLEGNQIPLAARIFTIADVFDALTSERPCRKAAFAEEALELKSEEIGTGFAPMLFARFAETDPDLHPFVSPRDNVQLTRLLAEAIKKQVAGPTTYQENRRIYSAR